LFIYFGQVEDPAWQAFGRAVFERFPAPVLKVLLPNEAGGFAFAIGNPSPGELSGEEREVFLAKLRTFTEKVWRSPRQRKYRWDMAILYDPEETMAPSDAGAIQRFIRAAAKVGIDAEAIRSRDMVNLTQYDALFIRETTSIDHLTYRLARRAEKEGLVAIDDPTSILRCCNKIFLHDAFSYNKVAAPRTLVVADANEATFERIESELAYPMVLKLPESSFSVGVFKVKDRTDLEAKLHSMLEESSLALVQEYLYTDYDWRIGVLNGRAIYACKYLAMAWSCFTAAPGWPDFIPLQWPGGPAARASRSNLSPPWKRPPRRRTAFSCGWKWPRKIRLRSGSTKSSATPFLMNWRTTTRTIPMPCACRNASAFRNSTVTSCWCPGLRSQLNWR